MIDVTYTFSNGKVSDGFEVRRTPDGYVTLKSVADGRCLETRSGKLTLNVPLEPGSPVTEEVCAVSDTLQRWELRRADGGYRLVNAITRMAVHATDDGRLVQYPPDQQQPALWKLTPS